jgi:hypothetical protein
MSTASRSRAMVALVLLLAFTVSACAAGATTTVITSPTTGATNTPAPPPCATHATAQGEAWSTTTGQIVGTLAGGAVQTLGTFTYPLGLPNETSANLAHIDSIAWAPDGHHLAVMMGVNLPDVIPFEYPYIVDTATHTATRVTLPGNVPAGLRRLLAWTGDATLLIFTGIEPQHVEAGAATGVAYQYDLATGTVSTLPGVVSPAEGVVRCSTLYWLELPALAVIGTTSFGTQVFRGHALLHRYNLTTHAEIGSPISLGDTMSEEGSAAGQQVEAPGWDVSPDGTTLAYQQMTVAAPSGAISSHFLAAHSDGSASHPVLNGGPGATSSSPSFVSVSPNGAQVAVTAAEPTPDVLSGAVAGGTLRAYTPDASGEAAWLSDSSGFDAVTYLGGSTPALYRYLLSTPLNGAGQAPGAAQVSGSSVVAALG